MSMTLKALIRERLADLADEAFDPETAEDSDGYDQGVRAGILQASEEVLRLLPDGIEVV